VFQAVGKPVGNVIGLGVSLWSSRYFDPVFLETAAWYSPSLLRAGTTTEELVAIEAARLAGTMATGTVSQVRLNYESGRLFEGTVIDDILGSVGGVKNTTTLTVPLSNGTVVRTIPDGLGQLFGVVEVKNVNYLTRSSQLEGQMQYAVEHQLPYSLVVNPSTTISKPLKDAVKGMNGHIYRYDPSTGVLTEVR
jgi:hypothetical protein